MEKPKKLASKTPITVTASLFLAITFILIQQGDMISGELEECNLSKIEITTHKTSVRVQGVREFLVVISNVCWCPQSNITLGCDGFKSLEPVDPTALTPVGTGSAFLVNGGVPLVNGRPVSFKYAWSTRFRFTPLDSKINC